MKTKLHKLTKGFTIIEVMIVLAIAGLILAIVFLAVPQLQRNARDNQRQSVVTRLKAELDTYSSNNQGTYPFAGVGNAWVLCNTQARAVQNCGDWFTRYIGAAGATSKVKITDPSTGADTNIYYSNSTTNPGAGVGAPANWAVGTIWIYVGDKCAGDQIQAGTATGSATSKQYAVLSALDRSGTFYCVDNG